MIAAWLRERFRAVVFVPVALVIGAAASAAGSFAVWRLVQDAAFVLSLLLQFRLWDDLADRSADAIMHPDRVLVKAPSTRSFRTLCSALGLINIVFAIRADQTAIAVSTLIALNGALALWYALRSRRSLAGDQLLLAKYPAFVLVVAGDRAAAAPLITAVAATLVYFVASVYEARHDSASPVGMLIGGRR
jgi:hypothetical protein